MNTSNRSSQPPTLDCGKSDLPEEVELALHRVIDYLWDDELAHYLETSPLENRDGHIFVALRTVAEWLVSEP